MTTSVEIHYQRWGEGPPVLALHGLGLESSSFTGLAQKVNELGLGMLAADLPGFGKTPAPEIPLTAEALAEPVIELARRLDERPLLMGMSLGARVALEAALLEPALFRGLVMMAPPLPRRENRWILQGARLLSPEIARMIPVERAWPWLKRLADRLEREIEEESEDQIREQNREQIRERAEYDWFVRASKRAIYYVSCPATRWAFVSAARELALDPAYGPKGVWTRLEKLGLPSAWVWGERDRFVDLKHLPLVEELVPAGFQVRVPCAGHFENGPHFRCVEAAVIEGVRLVEEAAAGPGWSAGEAAQARVLECAVETEESEDEAAIVHPFPEKRARPT